MHHVLELASFKLGLLCMGYNTGYQFTDLAPATLVKM